MEPQQGQARPHRRAPRNRGKLACCAVWKMSPASGDRCWKMGRIQKQRRLGHDTGQMCAPDSTAAPPRNPMSRTWATSGIAQQQHPRWLSEAQSTLWKWPGEKHSVQLMAGQGCYCLSSREGPIPAWDLSPHQSHNHTHSLDTLLGSDPPRLLGNSL